MKPFQVLAAVVTALVVAPAAAAPAQAQPPARLTNLAHLDFLTEMVTPPVQAGHTTYRLEREPAIGVLWVYADARAGGTYERVGGGAYDPATNTWGQGSYDADDISRAAVVYSRHWAQVGDRHSREMAYQQLRGLTYLQTVSGPDAGNVVLWMQPDGVLNPSAEPAELPDPSDSGPSYWLARTIWALGEGYAAFRTADPAFAAFLEARLDLAVAALERQVLTRYGEHQIVDGVRVPAWLIVDGGDASAEAVLGLCAYLRAGGTRAARTALARLATGIAALGSGDADTWPHGAVLPWALSRSFWHAWGAQMPAALAQTSVTLSDQRLLRPAVDDAAAFTPRLLTSTGPVNGWLPAPADGTQIAYGADARVQSLLSVAQASGSTGLRRLAGVTAGWYFGQNPGGAVMYDPGTGATFDGVTGDGAVNRNSGAESTIHGLLSMLALDANPDLAVLAKSSGVVATRDGQRVVEAESGVLAGPATVVTPPSPWTGESLWSGGAYVSVSAGSTVTWTVPAAGQPVQVAAVVNRVPGRGGVSRFDGLGDVRYGGGGVQGVSPAPGALLPIVLPRQMPSGSASLVATTTAGSGQLDALLLTPLVSTLVAGDTTLLTSVSDRTERRTVVGRTSARSYDNRGRLTGVLVGRSPITVLVPAGGFAIARG
ncbi:hypothetical protein AB0J74_27550 [Asanoa sp. NPDC049573]|uniref:hypothetical protein n=1 Tax=Asanoa sp. NPDC049573 TaxID=3155396 RepID=UPI00341AC216